MNKKRSRVKKQLKNVMELIVIIFLAILFRSVVFEPYVVPSTSMLPTLLVGDRVIVKKFAYGISRYSFPFSPSLFKGRLFEFSKPERGDVIVFETDKVYIKRLIGLPGDTVQMVAGNLFVNGKKVKKINSHKLFSYNRIAVPEYIEELPNGLKYKTLDLEQGSLYDTTDIYRIPQDHYFFMGDNRDHSNDSRNPYGISFVPYENLLGKVDTIFFSSQEIRWYNPMLFTKLDKDRFFKPVDE